MLFQNGQTIPQLLEPLLGLFISRPGVRQMPADLFKIRQALLEIDLQLSQILQDDLRGPLDPHTLETAHDRLEIHIETIRRDRNDFAFHGIRRQAFVLSIVFNDRFVIDTFGRDVHERELVGAFFWQNIFGTDIIDVLFNILPENLTRLRLLLVAPGFQYPLKILKREFRVDRDQPFPKPYNGIDLGAVREAVLQRKMIFRKDLP